MKNIRLLVFALMTVCALVAGFTLGFDSPSFAYNALAAVAVAIGAFMPKRQRDTDGGFIACDTDPVEQVKELAKELKGGVDNLRKQQEQLAGAQQLVLNAVEKGFKLDKETQDNIDAAIAKANDQSQQINEVQQKIDDIKKSINEGMKNSRC